jgi:hypothetical protein
MCKSAKVKQVKNIDLEYLSRADRFERVVEFSLLSTKVSP